MLRKNNEKIRVEWGKESIPSPIWLLVPVCMWSSFHMPGALATPTMETSKE